MTQTRAGKLLQQHSIAFREHSHEERSDHICKTILFKKKDGSRVAVLVPLQHRVSYKKIKEYTKQDVSPLSPDEVRAEGFEPGEVAPMLVQCELIVDPTCFAQPIVQTGSGNLGYGITWQIQDLQLVKQYILQDVAEIRKFE